MDKDNQENRLQMGCWYSPYLKQSPRPGFSTSLSSTEHPVNIKISNAQKTRQLDMSQAYPQLGPLSGRCRTSRQILGSGRTCQSQLPGSGYHHLQLQTWSRKEINWKTAIPVEIKPFTSISLDICLNLVSLAINPTSTLAATLDAELSERILEGSPDRQVLIWISSFYLDSYAPRIIGILVVQKTPTISLASRPGISDGWMDTDASVGQRIDQFDQLYRHIKRERERERKRDKIYTFARDL